MTEAEGFRPSEIHRHFAGAYIQLLTVGMQRRRLSTMGRRDHVKGAVALAFGVAVLSPSLNSIYVHAASAGPTDHPTLNYSSLTSVDEDSPQDVWAVGAFARDPFSVQEPLVVHYDGAAWRFVSTPITNGGLYDVSVINTSDAWAVGWFVPEVGGAAETLTLHWDGISWSQVPAPAPGATSNVRRVSSVSSDDVWAIGEALNDQGIGRSFIMRWIGMSWRIEHVVPSGFSLGDIDASSSTDAWAAGGSTTDVLMLHWDGITWHRVPAPDPGNPPVMSSVADVSSRDAWVAGTVVRFGTTPVLFHWDGVAWTYTEPDRVSNFGTLAAGSTDDVWATGYRNDPTVMHWNGSKWSTVHFQAPGHVWTGIVSDGPGSVWVVGHQGRTGSQLTTKHITIGGPSIPGKSG